MITKIAKIFKDARSIWFGIALLFAGAGWAGDLRWITIAKYEDNQKVVEIRRINNEISELQIKLLYMQEQQQKAMIQALIINKKTQIKNIKESRQ